MEPLIVLDRDAAARSAVERARPGGGPSPAELKRLQGAAREFEAMLIQHMLRSARESSLKGRAIAPGATEGFHRDLADQELARAVTASGGFGLTDLLVQGLSRQAGGRKMSSSAAPPQPISHASERETPIGGPR
ncbi:MAG: hypothetical protein A2X50_13200 [Candidatus Rokubacteria bacterium GWF2_70_14]|nr:MAG: hypothetical protein A2X50_13200 [Candidatus Rokubacteria bacterium GWF2_70_14]